MYSKTLNFKIPSLFTSLREAGRGRSGRPVERSGHRRGGPDSLCRLRQGVMQEMTFFSFCFILFE